MPRQFSVKIGNKVAYSVMFLKSIGMSHSDLARARGVVTKINKLASCELATMEWNDAEIPHTVNVQNLAIIGANVRFCRC